jgi:hypothetical protein
VTAAGALLAFAAAASAANQAPARPLSTSEAIRAHTDVRSALTSIHLLGTSVQATLKSLEWDFAWWGKPDLKAGAHRDFTDWSSALSAFREVSEKVSAASDPMAQKREELSESDEAREAAGEVPDSIGAKVADIRRLRAQYDPDASRQALGRARGAIGKARLNLDETQEAVISRARGLRASIGALEAKNAQALPKKPAEAAARDRAGAERVRRQLRRLEDDAEALGTEIERLELFFGLNNLLEDSP